MGKHILDGYASAVRTEAGKPFTINGMHMWRRRLWTISKAALAVAIVVGVARQFVQLLGDGNWSGLAGLPHWQTVVGVGLLYLAAHTSWGSFWVLLLREQGIAIGWYAGLRCYFVSQFGKYLPGKAWVIFLRVGMLQPLGAPGVAVAVTATYETLASMGAGALVAVVCLPWLDLLPVAVAGRWGWFVVLAGLPVAIGLMHRVVQVWLRRRGADLSRLASAPGWLLLARGLLHGLTGWLLLACSLWLLLNELLGGAWSLSFSYYPALLGALALAYVAGFVVLVAPGGLGVREWVLLQTLRPLVPESETAAAVLAALTALWLRLIWTVAEVSAAALLYICRPAISTITTNNPAVQLPSLSHGARRS